MIYVVKKGDSSTALSESTEFDETLRNFAKETVEKYEDDGAINAKLAGGKYFCIML